jgi:hypothetical protein
MTGSAPPDDRLREAISLTQQRLDCFVATARRNDENRVSSHIDGAT